MKLQKMTDFVLEQFNALPNVPTQIEAVKHFKNCENYAKFLQQPLTLGMLVPCDEEGNILEHPIPIAFGKCINKRKRLYEPIYNENEIQNYNNALEKVLFKDAVMICTEPYKQTKRVLIVLKDNATFRVYNQFDYHDGRIEKQLFPNNENLTIEDLIIYDLQLTESAIKQIGINDTSHTSK